MIVNNPLSSSRREGYINLRVKALKVIDEFNIINITNRPFHTNDSSDELFLKISSIDYNRATKS
jgi:hypothetical protein